MKLYHWLGLNDPVSSLTHCVAAIAALAGSAFLYKKGRGDVLRLSSLLIFSACLLFLFAMSGIYHALPPGPSRILFRRLDYAGIWLVIAGSATPVHVLLFTGRWRWSLTALFWGTAVTSLVLIDHYLATLPYWAIVTAYLSVSSLGLISFVKIAARHGLKETTLLYLGGIAYSAGAVIDYLNGPVILTGIFGAHELFHILVMVGATLHWFFIYNWAGRQPLDLQTTLPMGLPSADCSASPG